MSNTSDKQRFERVAKAFGQRLTDAGLIRGKLSTKTSSDGGWWAAAAAWPALVGREPAAGRPQVLIFLSHDAEGPERDFWFGFHSERREVIETLLREIKRSVPGWAQYDWSKGDAPDYRRDIQNHGGLSQDSVDVNEHYFGKYFLSPLKKSDGALVEEAARFVLDIIEAADPSFLEGRDIQEIASDKSLSGTQREALIMARRGQGRFRADLLDYWGGCAVSGCSTTEVLRASHIKPWRECKNDKERLDRENGLLLTATLDALFDQGLISFTSEGMIRISPRISTADWDKLGLHNEMRLRKSPSDKQLRYLKAHQSNAFKRDQAY